MIKVIIPGKPHPKARPRMVRGKIWTPSNPHEEMVAAHMMQHQGYYAGCKSLQLNAWFYGADPRSDGDNLYKLCLDAAGRAGVFDNDKYVMHGEFTKLPIGGGPYTRIEISPWP